MPKSLERAIRREVAVENIPRSTRLAALAGAIFFTIAGCELAVVAFWSKVPFTLAGVNLTLAVLCISGIVLARGRYQRDEFASALVAAALAYLTFAAPTAIVSWLTDVGGCIAGVIAWFIAVVGIIGRRWEAWQKTEHYEEPTTEPQQ